jgi:hypothetical protein
VDALVAAFSARSFYFPSIPYLSAPPSALPINIKTGAQPPREGCFEEGGARFQAARAIPCSYRRSEDEGGGGRGWGEGTRRTTAREGWREGVRLVFHLDLLELPI